MVDLQAAKQELLDWVSSTVKVPADELDLDKSFADMGLDSLDAVHMIATIESLIRQELPENVVQRVRCLNDIFEIMQERVAAA